MAKSLTDKIIVVTGGAGAIGSNIVNSLNSDNKVIVIDDLSSGYLSNVEKPEQTVFYESSILDTLVLEEVFKQKTHIVFHAAAHFANQNSVEHPEKDLNTNALGTLRMLECACRSGVDRFVYISSSCVYGNGNAIVTEDDLASTLDTPYAIHKLMGEYYTNYCSKLYGLNTVVLRYFNSYGPREAAGKYRNVIPNFFYKAMNHQSLTITGTGNETRDFTFVKDIVEGTILAATREEALGEVFNLGTGIETKIIDLANKINEITENPAGIEFRPRRDWDYVSRRVASIEKAKNLLGYSPQVDLDEGLNLTYDWFKENYELIEKNVKEF